MRPQETRPAVEQGPSGAVTDSPRHGCDAHLAEHKEQLLLSGVHSEPPPVP